jgi:AraC-like DNA-binding protein
MRAFHENRQYRTNLRFQSFVTRNIHFFAHWHQEVELVYVKEGAIWMGINREVRRLEQGDFAFCASGDIHFYDSKEEPSALLIQIFHPGLIGLPGGWPQDVRLVSPFLTKSSGARSSEDYSTLAAAMEALMKRAQEEWQQAGPCHEQIITGILHEMCGYAVRHMELEPADEGNAKRRVANMRVMQRVLDFLEQGYTGDITMEQAAQAAQMSPFYFSRFFRGMTGMSFPAYLNSIRVSRAEELIRSTNRTMLDIALECGFSNVRTFNRVFRQFHGIPPTRLRQG